MILSLPQLVVKTSSVVLLRNAHDVVIGDFATKIFTIYTANFHISMIILIERLKVLKQYKN